MKSSVAATFYILKGAFHRFIYESILVSLVKCDKITQVYFSVDLKTTLFLTESYKLCEWTWTDMGVFQLGMD